MTKQLLHRGFLLHAFTQQTATISHDALFGSLVWTSHITGSFPSPSLRVLEYGSSAVFAEQDAPQTTMQPPGLSHTHIPVGLVVVGDLTSGAQQALSASPPPPSPPTTGYPHLFYQGLTYTSFSHTRNRT